MSAASSAESVRVQEQTRAMWCGRGAPGQQLVSAISSFRVGGECRGRRSLGWLLQLCLSVHFSALPYGSTHVHPTYVRFPATADVVRASPFPPSPSPLKESSADCSGLWMHICMIQHVSSFCKRRQSLPSPRQTSVQGHTEGGEGPYRVGLTHHRSLKCQRLRGSAGRP